MDFHRDDKVLQFLEVRRILEPAAASLAAQRMNEEDTSSSCGSVIDSLRDDADGRGAGQNDLEFHRLIAAGTGNEVLCSLIDGMSGADHPRPDLAGAHPGGARTAYSGSSMSRSSTRSRPAEPEVAYSWATVARGRGGGVAAPGPVN